MPRIEWTSELEIGISVIDGQHHRIVDYINQLDALGESEDRAVVDQVIHNLLDYTHSHFVFEETLMEEAGYAALAIHKMTHKAFCDQVKVLRQAFQEGENITRPLVELLNTWLIDHIMHDDTEYAPSVRAQMPGIEKKDSGNWIANNIMQIFGKKSSS